MSKKSTNSRSRRGPDALRRAAPGSAGGAQGMPRRGRGRDPEEYRRTRGERPVSRPRVPAAPREDQATPPAHLESRQPDRPKLHKVLAQAGLGSRLEMETLIAEQRVSVNGQMAHVGQRVAGDDLIRVDGRRVAQRRDTVRTRVLLYHKPVGEVVTHSDPQGRPTVFDRLPRLRRGKWQSVGRLDLNTEGLLLVTNSGDLANRLMHPSFGLEREYAARVLGALTLEEKQRLLDGVLLADGRANFTTLREEVGESEGVNQWYRVTIAEGRNREVRRMFETLGRAVSRLIRVRYGPVALPRGLRRGQWMQLDARAVRRLTGDEGRPEAPGRRGLAGGGQPRTVQGADKPRRKARRAKPNPPRSRRKR